MKENRASPKNAPPVQRLPEMDYRTYLIWKSDHINNERKFLAWIRTSLALITLGFIVQRFDLFLLSSMSEAMDKAPELPAYVRIIPVFFFGLGGIMLAVATMEFFKDRRRINRRLPESTLQLDILILCTLAFLIFVTGVFLWPK